MNAKLTQREISNIYCRKKSYGWVVFVPLVGSDFKVVATTLPKALKKFADYIKTLPVDTDHAP